MSAQAGERNGGSGEAADAPPGTGTTRALEVLPVPALRAIVRHFLLIELPASHEDAHLPDTSSVAAFTLRGACHLDGRQWAPPAAFTGITTVLRTHSHRERHRVLLVRFTPGGAAALLPTSLEALAGHTTPLVDLLPPAAQVERLCERLGEAASDALRVALLTDFLLRRCAGRSPDPLVSAAATWLEQRPGARIGELTRHVALSQSALSRRFRRAIGITPKRFAAIVRLRHAVRVWEGGATLTRAAQEAGYFDQSHFINDFRRTTGRAPATFLRGPAPG